MRRRFTCVTYSVQCQNYRTGCCMHFVRISMKAGAFFCGYSSTAEQLFKERYVWQRGRPSVALQQRRRDAGDALRRQRSGVCLPQLNLHVTRICWPTRLVSRQNLSSPRPAQQALRARLVTIRWARYLCITPDRPRPCILARFRCEALPTSALSATTRRHVSARHG